MSAQRAPHERWWVIGGAVAAALIALLGWVLVISPQRAETDNVNGQAADVRTTNLSWENTITSLRAESKNMSSVTKALTAAQQALPVTSGVPDFLRALQRLGSATGTNVVSLAVGLPVDVSTVAGGGSANGAPASASSSPSASSAGASPAAGAPSGSGVYALTITAQINGPSDRLDSFLRKLQTEQPRAVLITHLTRGSADDGETSLQLSMQAFVRPANAAEKARLAQAAGR